ncbi:MAG: hypothetical protein E6J75_02955 [Deltaproteobacteria bacterium]|nr:MAG: hypothetical protein E6J75_02955 [Deltaproteobacteria bacterium]
MAGALLLVAEPAWPRAPGDPVRLVWDEGDVAGVTSIYGPDGGEPIGFVEYRQTRRGDILSCARVAHYRDGTRDEDEATARLSGTLEAVAGRSIIRDRDGEPVADVTIDVAGGRLQGTWGRGSDRQTLDRRVALPRGTYWGPLIFLVVKSFDANAEGDRVVFHTVAPSPRPIELDMEVVRGGQSRLDRAGSTVETFRLDLRPTVHWALDPLIHLVMPQATFYLLPGEPPALARFAGPRNYARQPIRIE